MTDVREELALESVGLVETDVGLRKFRHLEIQGFVHPTETAGRAFGLVQHPIERLGELLEVVAGPDVGSDRIVSLLHPVRGVSKPANGPQDHPIEDEPEQEDRQRHGEHADRDQVDAAAHQLPGREGARPIDDQESVQPIVLLVR